MLERDGYPAGVPCWVDLSQPDLDATMAFYGGLFGWTFHVRTPEGAPVRYAYALLDGLTVAGVGTPAPGDEGGAGWTSYVWVDSADDTAAVVEAHGGKVLAGPDDIPRAGRSALCADPEGAMFGLWQAAENRGAQAVNGAGTWNFSELHTPDPDGAERFYGAVFGWACNPFDLGDGQKAGIWRVPGYAGHGRHAAVGHRLHPHGHGHRPPGRHPHPQRVPPAHSELTGCGHRHRRPGVVRWRRRARAARPRGSPCRGARPR